MPVYHEHLLVPLPHEGSFYFFTVRLESENSHSEVDEDPRLTIVHIFTKSTKESDEFLVYQLLL